MANVLYTSQANAMLGGAGVDLDTVDIRAVLTDHLGDTPVPATDDFLDDISAGTISTSVQLTTPSISGGAIDFDDFVFATVSGNESESITIYYHTGTPATSALVVFYDTATGLPVTPNGANINVALNASGLFGLV